MEVEIWVTSWRSDVVRCGGGFNRLGLEQGGGWVGGTATCVSGLVEHPQAPGSRLPQLQNSTTLEGFLMTRLWPVWLGLLPRKERGPSSRNQKRDLEIELNGK